MVFYIWIMTMEHFEGKYEQEIINNAFRAGNTYLKKELSRIEMLDQLRMDGYPDDLASFVADTMLEVKNDEVRHDGKNYMTLGLLMIAGALILFVIPFILNMSVYFIPHGLFLTGVIFWFYGRSRKKESNAKN